jgi:hypothetical protein
MTDSIPSVIPEKLDEKMEYWKITIETPEGVHDILYGIEHKEGKVYGVMVKDHTFDRQNSLTCTELKGLLDILSTEKFKVKDIREDFKPGSITKCVQ